MPIEGGDLHMPREWGMTCLEWTLWQSRPAEWAGWGSTTLCTGTCPRESGSALGPPASLSGQYLWLRRTQSSFSLLSRTHRVHATLAWLMWWYGATRDFQWLHSVFIFLVWAQWSPMEYDLLINPETLIICPWLCNFFSWTIFRNWEILAATR